LNYDTYRNNFAHEGCRNKFIKRKYKQMDEQNFIKPTEAELEILQILWANGACSVKFINELLNAKRNVGYTTTLKTMQVMFEKKLLERERGFWKSHDYTAAVSQNLVQNHLLGLMVNSTFGGSISQLVLSALGNTATDVHDLAQIKAFIEKMEAER
jgi:BlaI family transcriptional regulator, penicillinase repressor